MNRVLLLLCSIMTIIYGYAPQENNFRWMKNDYKINECISSRKQIRIKVKDNEHENIEFNAFKVKCINQDKLSLKFYMFNSCVNRLPLTITYHKDNKMSYTINGERQEMIIPWDNQIMFTCPEKSNQLSKTELYLVIGIPGAVFGISIIIAMLVCCFQRSSRPAPIGYAVYPRPGITH
mmetsp:Transcript_101501/g.124257  ORF Transcript_101501/g.124257 Transcript_101501/m.124257 type:complete len:178 (+) Transcript_101501:81-614(+)